LRREGADLVLSARTAAALDAVAEEVQALAKGGLGSGDITRQQDCLRIAAKAVESSAASTSSSRTRSCPRPTSSSKKRARQLAEDLEVNVFGSIALVQAVVPQMKAQGRGAIVLVNSMSVRIVEPRFGGYAASKGALATAAQTLARELGPAGIRVNSVVPGYIWGPNVQAYFRKLAKDAASRPRRSTRRSPA